MAITSKEALQRAMNLCSKSEKAVADIHESLTRWGISSVDDRNKIVSYLLSENFINEERFSRSYVNDKHNFNSWGKIKIKSMLRVKRIDDQTINRALENLDSDKYFTRLKEELQKKRKSIKASNNYDLKARLVRFAASKGYETELIFKALDEIL